MLRAILSETFGCTGTWLRKSHRTVLILLLLASLSYFLLTPFTPSLFIEVAHILACVCGGEAGVCVLDLLSPRLTAGRRKHIFWLLLLTCGIFYATSTNTRTGNVEQPRSNQSILFVGITAMVPVWMGLYAKALFDEQFLSVYDRCDDNLSAISAFNLYNTMGNPPSTTASAGQPSKQRASALLALTFVIRFVLKMLNSIGLAIEDYALDRESYAKAEKHCVDIYACLQRCLLSTLLERMRQDHRHHHHQQGQQQQPWHSRHRPLRCHPWHKKKTCVL